MENTAFRTDGITAPEVDIMGIINVTGDSFYSGSRYLGEDGTPAVERILSTAEKMIAEGATIIDIGACSTRPGAEPVGEEEEWRRLEPALSALWTRFPDIHISIDTWWSSVIIMAHRLMLEIAGRAEPELIVNDISAGEDDPGMLPAAGRLGLRYIAMHKRGTSSTMQGMCDYDNVTEDVTRYFQNFGTKAAAAGVKEWILDPGFGFAKTMEQNYRLLAGLGSFSRPGLFGSGTPPRILVGVSRKSMIYRLHGISPEESLSQTQVLHLAALERGATILRVHDVAEAARTVRTFNALRRDSDDNKDVIPGAGRTLRQ